MTITSKYEGKCRSCGGAVHVGDSIEWSRSVKGVAHTVCPNEPEVVVPEVRISYAKLDDDKFGIRVSDPDPDNVTDREGEDVQITTRAGAVHDKRLGPMVKQMGPYEAIYEQCSPDEDLPGESEVPQGRYALEQDDGSYVFAYVKRWGEDGVAVYDDDVWGKRLSKKDTLNAIVEVGAAAAAHLYGQLRGRCSRCRARLENHEGAAGLVPGAVETRPVSELSGATVIGVWLG